MNIKNIIRQSLFLLPEYDSNKAFINGSCIFHYDSVTPDKAAEFRKAFSRFKRPLFSRIAYPVDNSLRSKVQGIARNLHSQGISPIILLDEFVSLESMYERAREIVYTMPFIRYVEILNELPFCVYQGAKIGSLDECINIINSVHARLKQLHPGVMTVSMPAYNLLDKRDSEWEVTNWEQAERIVNETATDCTAVHLYCGSGEQERRIWNIIDAKDSWLGKKPILCTEVGCDENDQQDFFNKFCAMFSEALDPTAIIWYRQFNDPNTQQDSGYALENGGHKTTFYQWLINY